MALDYSTYKASLADMAGMDSENNPKFLDVLPRAIEYAENRIYRDLDLLSTIVRQTGTLSGNTRDFTLPSGSGRFVTVTGINKLVSNSRSPLVLTSRDAIDALWPSAANSTPDGPCYYAMLTDQSIIVAPTSPTSITLEVVGTIRPDPLSETKTSTFLSTYLPDLFLAASMVFMAGWNQNYGSQSDNPAEALSWEQQYKTLLASASAEELRKKFGSMSRG